MRKYRGDAKLRTRKASATQLWEGSPKDGWGGVKGVTEQAQIQVDVDTEEIGALSQALLRRALPARVLEVEKCCRVCRRKAWEQLKDPAFVVCELIAVLGEDAVDAPPNLLESARFAAPPSVPTPAVEDAVRTPAKKKQRVMATPLSPRRTNSSGPQTPATAVAQDLSAEPADISRRDLDDLREQKTKLTNEKSYFKIERDKHKGQHAVTKEKLAEATDRAEELAAENSELRGEVVAWKRRAQRAEFELAQQKTPDPQQSEQERRSDHEAESDDEAGSADADVRTHLRGVTLELVQWGHRGKDWLVDWLRSALVEAHTAYSVPIDEVLEIGLLLWRLQNGVVG